MIDRDSQARSQANLLAELERGLDRECEQMQTPAQRRAVDWLFEVDGYELGQPRATPHDPEAPGSRPDRLCIKGFPLDQEGRRRSP